MGQSVGFAIGRAIDEFNAKAIGQAANPRHHLAMKLSEMRLSHAKIAANLPNQKLAIGEDRQFLNRFC